MYRKRGSRAFGQVKRYRGSRNGRKPRKFTEKEKEVWRQKASATEEQLDADYGFELHESTTARLGWLMNMRPCTDISSESGVEVSAICCYFLQQDGGSFKSVIPFRPYFLLAVHEKHVREVEDILRRRFPSIVALSVLQKQDLDLYNHLSGLRQTFLRLEFHTVSNLVAVRAELRPILVANQKRAKMQDAFAFGKGGVSAPSSFQSNSIFGNQLHPEQGDSLFPDESTAAAATTSSGKGEDSLSHIMQMREHDVPYYVRAAIDLNIRVGYWYEVGRLAGAGESMSVRFREDLVERPRPRVFAFDIETSKSALKFPDPAHDQVMMISYMVDGQGYLLINREFVGADVEDFEYTPKREYPGPFRVENLANERSLLERFCDHIRELRPHIFVTFNGDFFDWPFVETRCHHHHISMWRKIGVKRERVDENYQGLCASHMDAFRWVMRDSYLPQGSQGLKAVTKAKLGYDPLEIDPEDMVRFAMERPQVMASYSVSDAVATYYLYMKYVHPFIFSLCNIIPMHPDHVLRKGSGTLCENLLMVEAFAADIVFPNKKRAESEKFHQGHLLESETYIGGHVEALQAGVFRSDLPYKFSLDSSAFEQLMEGLDDTLRFSLEVEGKFKLSDAENYAQVRQEIEAKLRDLAEQPDRVSLPKIYHLDVGAMYPNIILTNRLQPSAIVDDATCAACDFNKPGLQCQRNMTWTWRGDVIPAHRREYNMIRARLENEKFAPPRDPQAMGIENVDPSQKEPLVSFFALPKPDQASKIKTHLKEYCKKVYKKTHEEVIEDRDARVCMRENSFYVDTVRNFRDRRYKYKGLLKTWQRKYADAQKSKSGVELQIASDMMILYDSLQLAHKCILNSFYGYVMRKGARWSSMEMAGIVTYTGANIIKKAHELVKRVGIPLELDTDGIWCMLPESFPENFEFQLAGGKKYVFNYPCVVLNKMVDDDFSNPQYHRLKDPSSLLPGEDPHEITRECTIFFEVDGPYRAMVLPASTEEGKKLKKRYAVFNHDGTLAELKGFELKRRGELKLIKIFQGQVFEHFLRGVSLKECYDAVARVAKHWLGVLQTKGSTMEPEELLELISSSSSMSRRLADYGSQKSLAITTARRLAEFLGDEMVKDKGLACKYIVSRYPAGAPKTDRAVPVAIFKADSDTRHYYLRKWSQRPNLPADAGVAEIVDWAYYVERLGGTIQKIITIPAALQNLHDNPVPAIPHPSWLLKKKIRDEGRQSKIAFAKLTSPMDIEDMAAAHHLAPISTKQRPVPRVTKVKGHPGRRGKILHTAEEDAQLLREQECPNPSEDYVGWLQYTKAQWREQRRMRAAERLADEKAQAQLAQDDPQFASRALRDKTKVGEGNESGLKRVRRRAPAAGTLASLLLEHQNAVRTEDWEILEISEHTDQPGELRMWILLPDNRERKGEEDEPSYRLQSVRVQVPRIIHLNCTDGDRIAQLPNAVRVEKKLPRGAPSVQLFAVKFAEELYQRRQRQLQALFTHPGVRGVYETNISSLFRALLCLQTRCKLSPVYQRLEENVRALCFPLHQLESVPCTFRRPYLQDCQHQLKTLFLYFSCCDSRGCISLLPECPSDAIHEQPREDDDLARGWTILIDPYQGATGVSMFEKEWHETQTRGMNRVLLRNRCPVTRSAPTKAQAFRAMNAKLLELLRVSRGPTVLVVQSSVSREELRSFLPASDELPQVWAPSNDRDDEYPAFGWQQQLCKIVFNRRLGHRTWLTSQIDAARCAQVPLGNLSPDIPLLTADLAFARKLQEQDHLLWISHSTRPDLGVLDQYEETLYETPLQYPQLNKPGCYRQVCVELRVRSLAINTILQSHLINDFEMDVVGGNLGAGDSGAASTAHSSTGKENMFDQEARLGRTFDDREAPWEPFRILKSMVYKWTLQLAAAHNENREFTPLEKLRDEVLEHIYRWISSPHSLLYDPAIHRLLHRLMCKVFSQLLGQFHRLGARIVHASFNRLIIATKKTSRVDAESYCKFIVDATRAHSPLFNFVELVPVHYWQPMLFLDLHNFGGRVCLDRSMSSRIHPSGASSLESTPLEEDEHGADGNSEKSLVLSAGNPKEGLFSNILGGPSQREGDEESVLRSQASAASKSLAACWTLAEYLPESIHNEFIATVSDFLLKLHESDLEKANRDSEAPIGSNTAEEEASKIISQLGQRLYKITCTMLKEVSLEDAKNHYRMLPGKGSNVVVHPAVHFVNSLCLVLSLHEPAQPAVLQLRRNLLRIVRVPEFSEDAEWNDPSSSFVLRDVVCQYCSSIHDLDLLRDPVLLERDYSCRVCSTPYNVVEIESTLVEQVQRLCTAYQLQDLKCVKCGAIKAKNMNVHCDACSGLFSCLQSSSMLEKELQKYLSLAKFHKFDWLQEVVTWLLHSK